MPARYAPLAITAYTITSCLGRGVESTYRALLEQRSGLRAGGFRWSDLDTYLGVVSGVEDEPIVGDFARFDCRNNRLAHIGLHEDSFVPAVQRARVRWGDRRIGVFIGTSTAGVLSTEIAYARRDPETGALPTDFDYAATHSPYAVAQYVREILQLRGPSTSISSACSSSAKAFVSASRMIHAGLIDAAVVGGVDSLCQTTLYGFNSLELLSSQPCRPFDRDRDGLSLGEAAAFALIERDALESRTCGVSLLGFGDSSDAFHMSSPHPEGKGATIAMQHALDSAGLCASDIDYINLHGTATPSNDLTEGRAVAALFGDAPCSSTKGATGHTLGAAGAVEAAIAAICLERNLMPAGVNTRIPDPRIPLDYLTEGRIKPVRRVLSNSFGFGGTNCSLIFGERGYTKSAEDKARP